ncbi:hypothetical protein PT974_09199 [Cladobotryum mycophilum]|uniref:Uncharacterized protein n=1 Tax=Cladobotryum mycophilum TaxID=491253 RepID=A0ABR0SFK1_9HYPO
MSDTSPNAGGNGHRRSSITQAALTNLFSRAPPFPNGSGNEPQRRRLSITTVGLSGTSPTNTASFIRRGSMSTNSDSIDENAIEDEDGPFGGSKTAPTTPFVRHTSFSGPPMRGFRQGASPGNGNAPNSPQSSKLGPHYNGPKGQRYPTQSQSISQSPGTTISAAYTTARRRASLAHPTSSFSQASNTKYPRASSDNHPSRADQYGFNWSEQLRSRAESSVTGARPSFSFPSGTGSNSPPRTGIHDRARSVSEMPQPPVQAVAVKPKQERPKPDAFQERILKGDFYMD